jgi:hypothetical protein
VRADRAYRLLHARGGLAPARLASPARFDQIEVVEVASGETVLHWDVPSRRARSLLRELRADLAALDDVAFAARWREREDGPGDEAGETDG